MYGSRYPEQTDGGNVMAKPAELRVAPRKGASPVEVKSLIQHLRLKYQVSQVAMQEAMGCSYYKL